jgi:hypothetical protein
MFGSNKITFLITLILLINQAINTPTSYSDCSETKIDIQYPSKYQEISSKKAYIQGSITPPLQEASLEIILVNTENWDTYRSVTITNDKGEYNYTLFENIDNPAMVQWRVAVQFNGDQDYCSSNGQTYFTIMEDQSSDNSNKTDTMVKKDSKILCEYSHASRLIVGDDGCTIKYTLVDAEDSTSIFGELVWVTVTRSDQSWYEKSSITNEYGKAEIFVPIDKSGRTSFRSYWNGNQKYNPDETFYYVNAEDKYPLIPSFPLMSLLVAMIFAIKLKIVKH